MQYYADKNNIIYDIADIGWLLVCGAINKVRKRECLNRRIKKIVISTGGRNLLL